jgi:hypothetical protein
VRSFRRQTTGDHFPFYLFAMEGHFFVKLAAEAVAAEEH